MDYEKKTIRVMRKHAWTSEEFSDVEATLVGGVDGVFATWKEGNIVYMAAGDDGYWREIASYHTHWIPDILCAIGAAQ